MGQLGTYMETMVIDGKYMMYERYPLENVYSLRTGTWPSRNSGFTHEK